MPTEQAVKANHGMLATLAILLSSLGHDVQSVGGFDQILGEMLSGTWSSSDLQTSPLGVSGKIVSHGPARPGSGWLQAPMLQELEEAKGASAEAQADCSWMCLMPWIELAVISESHSSHMNETPDR